MPVIDAVLTRIEVRDLDQALPAFQTLAGSEEVRRLEFPQFRMAIVGPYMLIEGAPEELKEFRRSATLVAGDHDAAVVAFTSHGGRVVDGPVESGGGRRSIVEDRDGNLFEVYLPGH